MLDRAVTRNLMVRMRLGMFDPPSMVPFAKMPVSTVGSKENLRLALQMAREAWSF
jgi:beta-glucosidase